MHQIWVNYCIWCKCTAMNPPKNCLRCQIISFLKRYHKPKAEVSKQDDDRERGKETALTSEKMVLKASTGHELVNKQPLIIFDAVPNKFNKIRMVKLPEEVYFSLKSKQNYYVITPPRKWSCLIAIFRTPLRNCLRKQKHPSFSRI